VTSASGQGSQLARNRGYAVLATAVLAMVLPGQDPITMLLLMAPMYALFEASIVVSWLLDRRARRAFVSASNAAS
jgi:sec-independent protein translocase protein TatC